MPYRKVVMRRSNAPYPWTTGHRWQKMGNGENQIHSRTLTLDFHHVPNIVYVYHLKIHLETHHKAFEGRYFQATALQRNDVVG